MKLDTILKRVIFGGIFLMPVLVFVVTFSLYFPFISGKNFLFRGITEIIFFSWVLLALRRVEYRPKFSWILVSLLTFFGIIALADFLGESPFKSFWSNFERMEGLVSLIHFVMFFLVVGSVMKTRELWNKFFNTTIVASALVGGYGLLQLGGALEIHQGGVRLDATFGNASYLAVYMLIHAFLTLFMFLRTASSETKLRLAYGAAFLLQIFILYHTATRGAIIGFVGGLLLTTLLIALFEKERTRLRKGALGALLGIIIVVGGFIAIKDSDFIRNHPPLARLASISLEAESNARFIIWDIAVEGIKERPILGWGQENFNYVFNKYYDPRLYAQESWFDRAHNIILDWAIAGGLLGLLSFLALLATGAWYLWRRVTDLSIVEKSIITGLFAGYIFHNLFVFDNLISYIFFFALLAYIHTLSSRDARSIVGESEISGKALQSFMAPFIVLLLLASLYCFNVPGLSTGGNIIGAIKPHDEGVVKNIEYFKKALSKNSIGKQETVEQLILITGHVAGLEGAPEEIVRELYLLSEQHVEKILEERPNDARLRLVAATFYNQFGSFDDARRHIEEAKSASPRKQDIYFQSGYTYLLEENYTKTLEEFKHAYDLEPDYPQAQANYALAAGFLSRTSVIDSIVEEMLHGFDERGAPLSISNNLIEGYVKVGAFSKIEDLWEAVVERKPESIKDRLSLALTYLNLGKPQNAIEQLEAVAEIDPSLNDKMTGYIEQIRRGERPSLEL